jgi:hypothetical protein
MASTWPWPGASPSRCCWAAWPASFTAIFPFLFETTGSRCVKLLYTRIANRGRKPGSDAGAQLGGLRRGDLNGICAFSPACELAYGACQETSSAEQILPLGDGVSLAHRPGPRVGRRNLSIWTRRKAIDTAGGDAAHALKKTLSWYHLIALGVGAIVGTGIYTLTGVGAGWPGRG